MPEWTADQKRVIETNAKTLICSAAAGSGKTAVLVERIVRMIGEGTPPDAFLIITFTSAAAAEMKEKIRTRLFRGRDNLYFRRALERIDSLSVSTIHSFCQKLIRQEFQAADVDPLFSVCTDSERRLLFRQSFRKACQELNAEGNADFAALRKSYDGKRTEELTSQVYDFILSLPDPFGWLRRSAEGIPESLVPDHPWTAIVSRMAAEKIYDAAIILRRQYAMFDEYAKVEAYRAAWKADSELFHVKQLWAEGRADTDRVRALAWTPLPRATRLTDHEIDWKERYQALRKELRELHEETDALILPDREKTGTEFAAMRRDALGLCAVVERTAKKYEEAKRRRHTADFADLEHKALKIMTEEPYRSAIREKYTCIFVDECQDISAVQDAMIRALQGEHTRLFMVGDVKQSIYRFRQADPILFLNRIREAESGNDPENVCIRLRENFRSRPEILETTNVIFRDIMREDTAEMDYTGQEELRAGRVTEGRIPVFVDLLENGDKGYPRLEAVADHLAHRMRELREEQGLHYRDMVILMPAVNPDGSRLAELLKNRGVPVFFDGGQLFHQMPEIVAFRRMLMWIVNPRQDLPLLSVLANAPFYFTEEELAGIRLAGGDQRLPFHEAFSRCAAADTELGRKCAAVREREKDWREKAEFMPLGDFCWYLMEDSLRYAVARTGEYGDTAQANLRLFCREASEAGEDGTVTLREYLRRVEELAAVGDSKAATLLGEKDDLVRIMTIHKSKGLQFPVVFCVGLDRSSIGSHPSDIRMDSRLGFCLRYKVPEVRLSRRTVANAIFEWKKTREEKAEKIRLLYVALTRAQERLFLVSAQTEDTLWLAPAGPQRVIAADTGMDWVMPALLDAEKKKLSTGNEQASTPWKIRSFEINQQKIVEKPKVFHNLRGWLESLLLDTPVEKLWKDLQEKDAFLAKRSVSSILWRAEMKLRDDEEETEEEKRSPEVPRRVLPWMEPPEYPAFLMNMGRMTGARRGTLIHRYLSLVDLALLRGLPPEAPENTRRDVLSAELERMVKEGVFTPEEAGYIRPADAERFFTSPVGRRMLSSADARREWNFNLLVPERSMIVQGIIDCAFREGNGWILLDYKTDGVDRAEELIGRYRPQLEWYRRALQDLTGLPVLEWWLYSVSLGEAVRGG